MMTDPGEGCVADGDPAEGDSADGLPPEAAAPARKRRRNRRVVRAATSEDSGRAEGQSSDDTATDWGERDESPDRDRWLREQRPPHWG